MNSLRYFALIFGFLTMAPAICGQIPQFGISQQLPKVKFDSFVNRPDLGVAIAPNAKFKIALRKSAYLQGEMMVLDIAMLTSSEQSHYFPTMDTLTIKVQDKAGRPIEVNSFLIADRRFSPLLLKGELELHSVNLIIGCRRSDLSFPTGIDNAKSDQEIFNRSLFVSKGDACIDITNPGNYQIFVELSNDLVAIPESGAAFKTAVGKIQSNKLQIFINH